MRPGYALLIAAAGALSAPAAARDYGQAGAVFPIVEPDLLAMIEAKLRRMQAAGEIDALNRRMVERTKAKVRRPDPVRGIVTTIKPRSWLYDPTITLQQDLRDHKGRLIAARGMQVNPLKMTPFRQRLFFLDGDSQEQVAWALAQTTPVNAKLILTKGSAFDLMGRHKRRFYHDQGGALTKKFGIRQVPAVVERAGDVLRVRELLPKAAAIAGRAAP